MVVGPGGKQQYRRETNMKSETSVNSSATLTHSESDEALLGWCLGVPWQNVIRAAGRGGAAAAQHRAGRVQPSSPCCKDAFPHLNPGGTRWSYNPCSTSISALP